MIWAIFAIILLIPIHELGHYLTATREGIYKGIGILPTPHIKLTRPFFHRTDYLVGILFSLILSSVWIIDAPFWTIPFFWVMCFATGAADILVWLFYGKLKIKEEKKT